MRHGQLNPILLTLALAGLYGCGDDVTDPDAFLESAEAEAVMRSARELPALPDLLEQAATETPRDQAVLLRVRELWAAGTVVDRRADARRRLAVSYALPLLTENVTAGEWAEARGGVDRWVETVAGMLDHLHVPGVADRISAARRYLARADATADPRRQSYYLLLAMSELVETTPRYVAQDLVDAASVATERASAAADGDDGGRALDRAIRLKDWAEQAVVEGDYLLAIQRAYYAIQLVEGP